MIFFPSASVFVSFFGHYCVHPCIKQFIKEVFWFIFEWIQKALTETSVWSN